MSKAKPATELSTTDSSLTYGFDVASPDGDTSALTIRFGSKMHVFTGEEAEAIQRLLARQELKGRKQALIEVQRAHSRAEIAGQTKWFVDDELTKVERQLAETEKER